MHMIKHVWFDFSDTIGFINKEEHDKLRYNSYAEVTGKKLSPELIQEFEELYQKHERSNSAIFRSLGQSSNFWSEKVNSIDPSKFYKLADESIPAILDKLRKIVPISIFSNIQLGNVLPGLGVHFEWFTHILSSGMVKEPKPALDGFYKIVELSKLPENEILYIGDDVGKDILPAKKVGIKTGLLWKKSEDADYCFEKFEDIFTIF